MPSCQPEANSRPRVYVARGNVTDQSSSSDTKVPPMTQRTIESTDTIENKEDGNQSKYHYLSDDDDDTDEEFDTFPIKTVDDKDTFTPLEFLKEFARIYSPDMFKSLQNFEQNPKALAKITKLAEKNDLELRIRVDKSQRIGNTPSRDEQDNFDNDCREIAHRIFVSCDFPCSPPILQVES
jgi:hypothetical protein